MSYAYRKSDAELAMTYTQHTDQITAAFPDSQLDNVCLVLKHLGDIEITDMNIGAWISEQQITIPSRVINKQLRLPKFSIEQQIIYWCILSRSTDGYIREKAVKNLVELPHTEFKIPYIFLSLSDYVIEIAQIVVQNYKDVNILIKFAAANPIFFNKTKAICISYWNEYYRSRYRQLEDYPPYALLNRLTAASK